MTPTHLITIAALVFWRGFKSGFVYATAGAALVGLAALGFWLAREFGGVV